MKAWLILSLARSEPPTNPGWFSDLVAALPLLGHVSGEMSLCYGRLFGATVRDGYERALEPARAVSGHCRRGPRAYRCVSEYNTTRVHPKLGETHLARWVSLHHPASGGPRRAVADDARHCLTATAAHDALELVAL